MSEPILIVILDNGAEIQLQLVHIDWWVLAGHVLTIRTFGNQPTDTHHVARIRGEWREEAS